MVASSLFIAILLIASTRASSLSLYASFHNSSFVEELPILRATQCDGKVATRICDTIDYLLEVKNLQRLYAESRSNEILQIDIAVETLDAKTPYSTMFENYILKNKPFKATVEQDYQRYSAEFPSESFGQSNSFTKDNSLLSSSKATEVGSMLLPKVLVNNYIRRLNITEDSEKLFNYKTQWPAMKTVAHAGPSGSGELEYCPVNMHLLVWGVSSDRTKMKIIPRDVAVRSTDIEFQFDEEEQLHRPLHHPRFPYGTGAEEAEAGRAQLTEVLLNRDEYLFVPNSFLVYYEPEDSSSMSTMMCMCFVDASNLELFREALTISSKISEYESKVLEGISSSKFDPAMTREPSDIPLEEYFSFSGSSITEKATDSGADTVEAPKPASGNRKNRRQSNQNKFKDWQAVNKWNLLMTSLTITAPSIPLIASIGRETASLSWSSSFVPLASDKTRFGFRLEICKGLSSYLAYSPLSAFVLGDSKSVDAMEGCEYRDLVHGEGLLREEHIQRGGTEENHFSVSIAGLLPNTSYRISVALFYDATVSRGSPPSGSFTTHPITAPAPIEILLPGGGGRSEDSILARSITIAFSWPLDDGGAPIRGFHIIARQHEADKACAAIQSTGRGQPLSQWEWVGAFVVVRAETSSVGHIQVKNLVPRTVYEFKVSAYNAVGNASYSQASACTMFDVDVSEGEGEGGLSTGKDYTSHRRPMDYTLFGFGHSMRSGGAASSIEFQRQRSELPYERYIEDAYYSHSLVEIDSKRQSVQPYSDKKAGQVEPFEMWRCYWGGNFYNVVSEVAKVLPVYAESEILNAGDLVDRIAIVARGRIPFVEKALRVQRAGAIALIIVDDGSCSEYDQGCIPGANKASGEDFALLDFKTPWMGVRIPVYFALQQVEGSVFSAVGGIGVESRNGPPATEETTQQQEQEQQHSEL